MHNVKMNVPPQWRMCPYSTIEFPHVHQTSIFAFNTSWTLSLSYMNYVWKNKNTYPCMGTSSTCVGDYYHYLLHPCRNIICCMHASLYMNVNYFFMNSLLCGLIICSNINQHNNCIYQYYNTLKIEPIHLNQIFNYLLWDPYHL
jgi:hypothetical protein